MNAPVHSCVPAARALAPASRDAAPARPHRDGVARHEAGAHGERESRRLHDFGRMGVHPGGGDDAAAEREADALARRVVGAVPETPVDGRPAGPRHPARLPRSVNETIGTSGEALPAVLRDELEAALGHDLGHIRVHRDEAAARSATAVAAEAYAVGRHIVFARDRFAPQGPPGRALLVHELAHVLQQSAAPGGAVLQRKPGRGRGKAPFEKVLKLQDEAARSLGAFVATLKALPTPSAPLARRIAELEWLERDARAEQDGAAQVIDAWIAGEEIPIDAPVDSMNYVVDDRPSARGLAMLERRETQLLALIDLVRPSVKRLTSLSAALGVDTPEEMREAFDTVAGHYLGTLSGAGAARVFEQVRFLDTFYADPRLIQGYGMWAYVRKQLPDLYQNVLMSMANAETVLVIGPELKGDDPRYTPAEIGESFAGGLRGMRTGELQRTINALRDLKRGESAIGEPPASLDQVGTTPAVDTNAALIRFVVDIQVRVAVLHLWQPIQPLQELLYGTNNAGESLLPFVGDDRQRWLDELNALQNEFAAELRQGDHPAVDGRIDGWLARLQPLIAAIPSEVRLKKIIAAIVEQLPFMFVAGASVARLGAWIRLATQSKWLAALGEGAAMTLLNAASAPAGSAQRPHGLAGWTKSLVVNVLLSRVGRVFSELGTTASAGRSAIVRLGARVVLPTVAMASLQTGVQVIEVRLRDAKGETGFTELLTLNLVLSGIGMAVGAATAQPESAATPAAPGGGTALTAPVRPGVPEVAQRLGVPQDDARLLTEFADRLGDFKTASEALNEAGARGRITQPQFEALRKQGLDIADFLEDHCEPLAKSGALGETTPSRVKMGIASMRAKFHAMDFASLTKVRALLPEATEGLVRAGDGEQWIYDRNSPPPGLAALRSGYAKPGNTVEALPSGGFEARDDSGAVLARIVPVDAQAVATLGRSLASMAKGPLAAQGLAKARAQKAVATGLLEAQLEQAGSTPAGAKAVPRVLQHLARFVEAGNGTAWSGLSHYLSSGGDAPLLARAMAYGQPNEFAAESKDLADQLLTQMAGWDAETFDGFRQLYVLRPKLTAARLHSLIGGFHPVQVRGIFQAIAVLAPRSRGLGKVLGPLTSGAVSSERGAMGALTSGVQLAERYPGTTLVFEDPVVGAGGDVVRVLDISVQETRATRVAGVEKTETVEIAAFEIKEVSSASLGKRAPQELARDIERDAGLRAKRLAPAGGSRPFFETFRWRIRDHDIRQQAIDSLKDPAASPALIDARMREIVEAPLRRAFDRPEFKRLPPDEQDGYRNAFKGVPFVEFF